MAILLGALALLTSATPSWAADPSEKVSSALADLEKWLGTSDFGKTWNAYLKTDQLKDALAKPEQADPSQLAAILAQYNSGASGLDKPRFVAVKEALSKWHAARLDSTLPTRDDLSTLAEKIQDQMGVKTGEDVQRAKAQLKLTVAALGSYLNAHGRVGRDWKRYLQWNNLEAVLAAEDPKDEDVRAVLDRFEADKDGLEMPQYIAVRDALRKYYYTDQAQDLGNVGRSLVERVKQLPAEPRLQALLKDYGPETNHIGAVKIGAYMGELERFHQAPILVRAVRKHLSHPNLAAYVRDDLVIAAMGEKLDETIKVRENILGTSIYGNGHLTGELAASLVPDDRKGQIRMALTGVTKTKTTGYNGPVTLWSHGETQLEGSTLILLTSDGVSHTPATGKAVTKNQVDGLSARLRLVERAAWKRVGQSQGAAQREASAKATARLKERMNSQADENLAKANHDYAYKFRDPMIRRSAFPTLLDIKTTAKAIEILMQQAASDQLGAPAPPATLEQNHDMAVRLHESLVNNLAATRLGGQTLTDKSAAEAGQTQEQAEKLKERINKEKARNRAERFAKMTDEEKKVEMARREKADKEQKFSIKLAELNPVSVEFRDGKVRFTIRGTSFEGIDGRRYDEHPMSIWGVYHLEKAKDGGLTLVMKDQDKDWGVLTTQAEYGGAAEAGAEILRAKLKARFGDIFIDLYRIELEPLLLPGKLERAGRLAYKEADSQGGWLTLAWDRLAKAPPGDKVVEGKKVTTR